MLTWQEFFIYCTFTVCTTFWTSGFIIGGIISVVFGSACCRDKVYDSCGSENGAILMIVFGALAIIIAVVYIIFLIVKHKKVDDVLSEIDSSF